MNGDISIPTSSNNTTKFNHTSRCLSDDKLQMHGSEFERYLQRYLFPCLVLFGIFGNAINLIVLLNKKMGYRANLFLATLAIADIAFLLLLTPNILANYSFFEFNYYFRLIYLTVKLNLVSFANYFSAVALWCVIAFCAERLIAIRNPLYIRSHMASYKMVFILAVIVVVPGIFIVYQHFSYKCKVWIFCYNTQVVSRCLPVNQDLWFHNRSNPYPHAFRKFIDVSILLHSFLIVIFPIIALIVLNIRLIYVLRQRFSQLAVGNVKPYTDSNMESQQKSIEHRVTLTATLIVTIFTVTNGPSAVLHLLRMMYQSPENWYNKNQYDLTLACNTLVIFGKAFNFILFCLSSKHFRRRLFDIIEQKMHKHVRLGTFSENRLPMTFYTPRTKIRSQNNSIDNRNIHSKPQKHNNGDDDQRKSVVDNQHSPLQHNFLNRNHVSLSVPNDHRQPAASALITKRAITKCISTNKCLVDDHIMVNWL